jgi:hypothetical protein
VSEFSLLLSKPLAFCWTQEMEACRGRKALRKDFHSDSLLDALREPFFNLKKDGLADTPGVTPHTILKSLILFVFRQVFMRPFLLSNLDLRD